MTPDRLQQIEALYHSAREGSAEQRAALLAQADPELRREVESLLAVQSDDLILDEPASRAAAELLGDSTVTLLAAGACLGPYRIESKLGEGGMGEVFRAVDTRLGRPVAIKIAREKFSARFEREARVIASLNHPHICTLYDVGPNYLVMELVEGETLSARLKKGVLPTGLVLRYGVEIAEALAAAHAKGIVHRDLKPSNIMVTKSGINVLDFGLAQVEGDALSKSSAIMGTPAYMAPEQMEGKKADARTDIFALGLVLYEMASGQRPGNERASVELPGLDRLIGTCLATDPDERMQSARDLKHALTWTLEQQPAAQNAQSSRRISIVAAAAATLVALALGALSLVRFHEAPEARVVTTNILPPPNTSFDFEANLNPPSVSPDGRRIVFGARGAEGKTQLWVRSLDSAVAQSLAGTDNAQLPFWSPDSRSIAFIAGGKLKRIEATGGPVLTLADAPQGRGGSWGSEGVIVFAPWSPGPLQRAAATGGDPRPATTLDTAGDFAHELPWFLPDGRHFLFEDQTQPGTNKAMLRIGGLDSPEVKTLGSANSNAVYANGYLLYLRENTLMAQPFDTTRLATTGDAAPVAEGVRSAFTPAVMGVFSVSRQGLLAYQGGVGVGPQQMTWFDRSGKRLPTLGDLSDFWSIDFSPDGKSLAATRLGQNINLWIYDVERGLPRRFTFGSGADQVANWSPDGRSIIYSSNTKGPRDLYRKAVDGTGSEELLYADAANKLATSWSPDGKSVLFFRLDPKTHADIWVLPLRPAPSNPFPWLATPATEGFPKFSPDGRWVAYTSDESGAPEVFVAPFPGPGGKREISTGGGRFPRWPADGKEIFYVAPNGTLMAAEVSISATTIEVGAVRPLGIPVITNRGYMYDVSTDGQRFLVAAPREQQESAPLTLVQNWTALLKKK
jgi:serine/threonine protein kinase